MTKTTKPRGARKASEPDLVGAKEAAELLGVAQNNLRTYRGIPEPYQRVAATTLYRRHEIEVLAAELAERRAIRQAAAHA